MPVLGIIRRVFYVDNTGLSGVGVHVSAFGHVVKFTSAKRMIDMAVITFKGICSGTEDKIGRTSGKSYQITKFVELPSMKAIEVFGDLGLPVSLEARDYVLNADVVKIQNVVVITGGAAVKTGSQSKAA